MGNPISTTATDVKSAADLITKWADEAAPVIEGLDPAIKAQVDNAVAALNEFDKVVDAVAAALGAS